MEYYVRHTVFFNVWMTKMEKGQQLCQPTPTQYMDSKSTLNIRRYACLIIIKQAIQPKYK